MDSSFQMSGTVRLSQSEGKRFRFLANSGKPFDHMHGRTIVDLASIRVSRPNLPILVDHDTSKRVGVTESTKLTNEGFVVEGHFIDSEDARDVVRQAQSGFPWEASISINEIEHFRVREGENTRVNGQLHSGPLMILRNGNLREVSFVAVAADQSTNAVLLRRGTPPQRFQKDWETMSAEDRADHWHDFDQLQSARHAETVRGTTVAELRARWDRMAPSLQAEFRCDFNEFRKSRGGR